MFNVCQIIILRKRSRNKTIPSAPYKISPEVWENGIKIQSHAKKIPLFADVKGRECQMCYVMMLVTYRLLSAMAKSPAIPKFFRLSHFYRLMCLLFSTVSDAISHEISERVVQFASSTFSLRVARKSATRTESPSMDCDRLAEVGSSSTASSARSRRVAPRRRLCRPSRGWRRTACCCRAPCSTRT
jgi:hypothetical protein